MVVVDCDHLLATDVKVWAFAGLDDNDTFMLCLAVFCLHEWETCMWLFALPLSSHLFAKEWRPSKKGFHPRGFLWL